jgi:hypothetical protein
MAHNAPMVPVSPPADEPSIVEAAVRVFEAGQRVVLDRVDLARLDLAQIASRMVRGAVLIAVGAVLVAGAWFTFLAGVVVWLDMRLPLTTSLAVVGLTSAAAGAAALMLGVRRAAAGKQLASVGSRDLDHEDGHDRH